MLLNKKPKSGDILIWLKVNKEKDKAQQQNEYIKKPKTRDGKMVQLVPPCPITNPSKKEQSGAC
jgi:hypothetical protein